MDVVDVQLMNTIQIESFPIFFIRSFYQLTTRISEPCTDTSGRLNKIHQRQEETGAEGSESALSS